MKSRSLVPLDTVTHGRAESKRLAYLAIRAPSGMMDSQVIRFAIAGAIGFVADADVLYLAMAADPVHGRVAIISRRRMHDLADQSTIHVPRPWSALRVDGMLALHAVHVERRRHQLGDVFAHSRNWPS